MLFKKKIFKDMNVIFLLLAQVGSLKGSGCTHWTVQFDGTNLIYELDGQL